MADEDVDTVYKNQRTRAKSKFTRKLKEFLRAVDEDKGLEIVNRTYEELQESWKSVESKHDAYAAILKEEDQVESESWIEELQRNFANAMEQEVRYVQDKVAAGKKTEEDEKHQEAIKREQEKGKRMVEQAIVKRKTSEIVLRQLIEDAKLLMQETDCCSPALKKTQEGLDKALADCKQANNKYLELLDEDKIDAEIDWTGKVQREYNNMTSKIAVAIANNQEKIRNQESVGQTKEQSSLRLEKLKMPRFDGDLRKYPRFKKDFEKQVLACMPKESAPYALRSCLGEEPLSVVRTVDDNIDEMLKRLDEKYGDPAKVVDVIIDSINAVKVIKDGEHKRFVEFVNIVEDAYRDLVILGLEKEITTTSSVSIIEKKLPADVRKEWAKLVSFDTSDVDKRDKFPSLLKFLLNHKRAIEYDSANLRLNSTQSKGTVNLTGGEMTEVSEKQDQGEAQQKEVKTLGNSKCLFHPNSDHWTDNCVFYLSKSPDERFNLLKEKAACWSCLRVGHRRLECRRKRVCGENGCKGTHHKTIHADESNNEISGCGNTCTANRTCLLQVQRIKTSNGWANVLWDNAASLSFITYDKAKEEKLHGTEVQLTITKVGGIEEELTSHLYKIPLINQYGKTIIIEAYGIERITTDIQSINLTGVVHLFKGITMTEVARPTGPVDILIGYEYAGFHPQVEKRIGHLLLLQNQFGKCLGGKHPNVQETHYPKKDLIDAQVLHVGAVNVDDFYNIESLGISCSPRCGNCRCGKCPIGSKDYNLKEERELKLIESKLKFDDEEKKWIAEYPWIRSPKELPDNKRAAMGMLISTERRLAKNPDHAVVYQKQIEDMVHRGVAKKLTQEELDSYRGPIHYISHHEVMKPDSKSTPVRIVFNSSANFMGHTLNEYWAKGPDLLNNLLGVLIRFRENEVALMGDVKKMYHSVKVGNVEKHTHRFLWRDMDTSREPGTYIIQTVSFGDKPAGTIATVALRKTAEMYQDEYPEAAKVVKNNSYMDDILDSVSTEEKAYQQTKEIEAVLGEGGFEMKGWVISGESNEGADVHIEQRKEEEKVLGIAWSPSEDCFHFEVKLNFSPKKKKLRTEPDLNKEQIPREIPTNLTKRMILSQVNSIYDPLGLAGPFTVRAKIIMRKLLGSEAKLDWDDPVPEEYRKRWIEFFSDLFQMEEIEFKRCLKPAQAIGDPVLVTFSDGSEDAYGTCAYARWEIAGGGYQSRLMASKNRLSPIKKMSIDRIELCGAVLNKRLTSFIEKESRYQFTERYHIVDSQIVRAMIQKETYGFNTFAATRIGEIQEGTNPADWYWIEGELNIADWITRGKKPSEIGPESSWQNGPKFLKNPVSEWPVKQTFNDEDLPERVKLAMATNVVVSNTQSEAIDIARFSSYTKLIRVTARVIATGQKNPTPSLKNAAKTLTPSDLERAETFWIQKAQESIKQELDEGKFKRLCPRKRHDGIVVVGGRAEKWLQMSYNQREVILLPYKHRFSRLYAEHIHNQGHQGVSATASKVRSRYWIPDLHKMVKSIKLNCVACKKIEKKQASQAMGKLPEERLKPAPPWTSTAIDLFGPFKIRDEVKKRAIGKAYGVLFNCLATRAVHVDLAPDYSTEKFLMVLRRFVSIRGYPAKLRSDNGTQLTAANEELQAVTRAWNWEELREFGVTEGMQWEFTSADAPWQNGCSEALIKSIKKALTVAIGDSILTFSELQTVCFEAANLVNERPIGRHPTSPQDGTYLCPNDLLLGRSTSRVPSGPFRATANPNHRHEFVQQIVDAFWKKWTRDHFPSLIVQQKWHTDERNLAVGDIVLIQDSNQVRGNWKLGRVSKVKPGNDGKVRNVEVQYKNPKPGEPAQKYDGRDYVTVERAVHRLVVLLPVDDKD